MASELRYAETIEESLEELDGEKAERIIKKLDDITDFPEHYLSPLTNHPGYKLRVGDFRIVIDWDKDENKLYAIDVLKRKKNYRNLGKYQEVWGSWRDE